MKPSKRSNWLRRLANGNCTRPLAGHKLSAEDPTLTLIQCYIFIIERTMAVSVVGILRSMSGLLVVFRSSEICLKFMEATGS